LYEGKIPGDFSVILVLDMPEAAEEQAAWLDRHLVSDDLAAIVDELSVIHDRPKEDVAAEEGRAWLGPDREKVLSVGVAGLSRDRFRELLRRPALLIAIQEIVLLEGGSYWDRLVRECQQVPSFEMQQGGKKAPAGSVVGRIGEWQRRAIFLGVVPVAVAATVGALILKENLHNERKGGANNGAITRGIENGGKTASVTEPAVSWGWSTSELIAAGTRPETVPSALADSLEEWFRVTAGTETDGKRLQLRVSELWAACDRVASMTWEGMSKDSQKAVHDVAVTLQAGLQATLKDLRQSADDPSESAKGAAAKQAADSAVREAIEQLRGIR
jgi:hypothetical protein